MVSKRIKFYTLFFIIPAVLFFGFLGLLTLTTISIQPETQIKSFGTLPDAYAILDLTVNSQEEGLRSTTLKYYLYYYVKVGSTHPASFTILQLGSNPRARSVPFSGLKHEEGVYYTIGEFDYYLWTYEGTMDIFVQSSTPDFFPADTYKSQTFYVWFNLTMYPSVDMEPVAPQGFSLCLKNAHLENAESVWNQYPPYMRLGLGKPEVSPLAFQIVEQRTFSTFLLFYVYLWFPILVIYYVALSANVVEAKPTQKILMFVGLSIAVIAFLWSIRQVLSTLTIVEAVIMLMLLTWIFIEARRQYYKKESMSNTTKMRAHKEETEEVMEKRKEDKEEDIEREQVRGLYIIGLLAILVTIKLTVQVDPLTDQFLLYVITSWAVYSFCMIFAFSNLPKTLVNWFKGVAEIFLLLSLLASVGYFIIVSYVLLTVAPIVVITYFLIGILWAGLILIVKWFSTKKPTKEG